MNSAAEAGARAPRLDRCGAQRTDEHLLTTVLAQDDTRVLVWSRHGMLVDTSTPGQPRLVLHYGGPGVPQTVAGQLAIFLGRDENGHAWVALAVDDAGDAAGDDTAEAASEAASSHLVWLGLRDVGFELPPIELDAFMTAQALASWHRTHVRCPRCGAPTVAVQAGWVRRCEVDGSEHYPRSDPAVIMAVIDDRERLLLARSPAWPQNRRSVLAGFVEPGERLEETVAREVAEEVGVTVHDVQYFGSQPWPFPASLMLGFTARATDPTLHLDDAEIVAAEWYSRDQLRSAVDSGALGLPGRLSIARRLIEGWYGEPLVPPVELPFHRPDATTTTNTHQNTHPDKPSSGR
ncbi:NAD+ diphosphatase [Kineosphaera limosa]|uniref:NAD(+) diphosphatase n=1 Tax=Kineosphaera limosa NBRC 100340 TaxID=1184609 RepID=K6WTJ5_9MICO|nr:NAD(+) diphosphatase [Kineosphaera limosa]NYE02523.1 NAD+ diphosphatase [Kineosphaera limosa]GAB97176.1 putative hydrolase [Kineosphaera limosa NBRC 100340]